MNPLRDLIEKRVLAPGRRMKETQFEELPSVDGAVVFLGDSITEGGAWHEWFPDATVANRGIDGDTTDGVLARLPVALRGEPSLVLLLIGTNDLGLKRPRAQTVGNVEAIVRRIRDGGQGPALVVQSIMPRGPRFRARINDLNREYERIAATHGARYLDLWPTLDDGEGSLRPECTLDRLHLTGAGYRAWVEALRPYVPSRFSHEL